MFIKSGLFTTLVPWAATACKCAGWRILRLTNDAILLYFTSLETFSVVAVLITTSLCMVSYSLKMLLSRWDMWGSGGGLVIPEGVCAGELSSRMWWVGVRRQEKSNFITIFSSKHFKNTYVMYCPRDINLCNILFLFLNGIYILANLLRMKQWFMNTGLGFRNTKFYTDWCI